MARNAALATGIAQSAYLPRVTASVVAGYQASNNRNSTFGYALGARNDASGGISALSAEWLLFDFGQRAAVVEAARQTSLVSNIAFNGVHQQLIYNVSVAFYANAAAQAHVENADKALKNAQDVQLAAEARYKRGVGTVIEVAQARQATAQAQVAQVQSRGAAQNSFFGLLSAMGISPLAHLKIADVSRRNLSAGMMVSVDKIVSDALARRPDMLSAYAAQKASEANVRGGGRRFPAQGLLVHHRIV